MIDRRQLLSSAAGWAALPVATWPIVARAVPRPPTAPRRLHLVNPHTGETFAGPYRDENGPIPAAMADLCAFLRDFHCGAETAMDVGVIDFLADLVAATGETKATILSAYRTPETNAMLARTTFGVAEHSQHMYGRALDFTLGAKLEAAMTTARAMHRGGVGWYPHSNFIHIDTGPVRNWTLDESGLGNLLLFDGDGGLVPFGGARHPLTTAERLALHRQLARAEFLARRHWGRSLGKLAP